jgi:hypothetical protein
MIFFTEEQNILQMEVQLRTMNRQEWDAGYGRRFRDYLFGTVRPLPLAGEQRAEAEARQGGRILDRG